MRSSEDRIHSEKVSKKRAKKRIRDFYDFLDHFGEPSNRLIGKHSHSPAICSCQMCRNPRRSSLYKGKNRKTIQEQKDLEYVKDIENGIC